jgi:hypothetical protein
VSISATDPIGLAMSRTGRMLFKPFDITKWFVLGFAAFLAYLGEGAYTNANSFPGPGGGKPGQTIPDVVEQIRQWFLLHAHWILPVAFVSLLVWIAITWIRARGKFVVLDGVAKNHAAIVAPWKRFRAEANSFFVFDLTLSLGMTVIMVLVTMLTYAIALPDMRTNTFGAAAITAIAVGVGLFLLFGLTYMVAVWIGEDFLIPLMYARSQTIGPAWAEFRSRIVPGHVGVIALYALMRVLLGIAAGTIVMFGTCLTCCIAALPYLSSVFFLPLFVFARAYSLLFLAQFGSEYAVTADIPDQISAFPVIFNVPPGTAPLPMPPLPADPAESPPPTPPQGGQP